MAIAIIFRFIRLAVVIHIRTKMEQTFPIGRCKQRMVRELSGSFLLMVSNDLLSSFTSSLWVHSIEGKLVGEILQNS